MSFQLILFYTLAAIILFGALKTVTAKNPVHAALWLVLTFCMSAITWLLMQAEFLGITLVVVYVGAVMVMFLFVVMMLNIDIEAMRQGFWRHAPAALVVGVLMAALLIMIFVAPDTALQVRVNPNEGRMRLVSMPAEVQTPRTQPETETTEESQA